MKMPTSTVMNKAAAVLAIIAGLLVGALWFATPLHHLAANHHGAASLIDPAIPTLTIVAKKLSAAEKRQLAADEQTPAMVGMLDASDRTRQMPKAPAF